VKPCRDAETIYADSFQLAESDATKPWRSLTFYGAQTSSLTLTYDRAIPPRTARSHASETDGRTDGKTER